MQVDPIRILKISYHFENKENNDSMLKHKCMTWLFITIARKDLNLIL